jgi:hypothetical protein
MALSSVAALRGNLGQANYCAANRAMAALLRRRADADGIRCRTVWLPPVEGAGMADAAEVRELLTLRGMGDAYVGAHEIAGAFEREAGAGGPESVVLARSFPGLPEAGGAEAGRLEAGVASFARSDLPLVDTVERLDLGRGVAVVSRAVNQERDLWLADHKPVKGSSDPLFSGVMAVESLIEAAQVLFPHLRPRGLRDVEFRLPLGIPAGQTRVIRCESERTAVTDGEVICAVRLSVADESAAPGAGGEGWLVHFRGNVVLGVGHAARPRDVFRPIGADEMDTGPVDEAGVSAHYDRETDLGVRYRVTDSVVGTGPHCILSRTVCRGSDDFSGMTGVRYRCAPYVLEALIQLSALHPGIRQARAPGLRLPAGLRSVRLFLPPAPGDLLLLSGRLVASDGAGETWDCAAFDAEGAVVMAVEGLRVSRSVRT